MDTGGKENVQQGLEYEADVYNHFHSKFPKAKIEKQVKQDGLIADIVLTRRSGIKDFIECKYLRKTKLSISDVDQVLEYRKVMGNPKDRAWLVTPKETEHTGNVDEYAKKNTVNIIKVDE